MVSCNHVYRDGINNVDGLIWSVFMLCVTSCRYVWSVTSRRLNISKCELSPKRRRGLSIWKQDLMFGTEGIVTLCRRGRERLSCFI